MTRGVRRSEFIHMLWNTLLACFSRVLASSFSLALQLLDVLRFPLHRDVAVGRATGMLACASSSQFVGDDARGLPSSPLAILHHWRATSSTTPSLPPPSKQTPTSYKSATQQRRSTSGGGVYSDICFSVSGLHFSGILREVRGFLQRIIFFYFIRHDEFSLVSLLSRTAFYFHFNENKREGKQTSYCQAAFSKSPKTS